MLCVKKEKIPAFEELCTRIRILSRRKEVEHQEKFPSMNSISTISTLEPIIPLILKKSGDQTYQRDKFISFELRARAGQRNDAPTYKKQVKLFDQGTPQEWIDVRRVLTEIWSQNSINGPTDRKSIVRAILRGESLTTFDTAIDTERTPEEDLEGAPLQLELTQQMVQSALDEVAKSIFPRRALEIQKLWMAKVMKKPSNLSIRQTISAIGRLNNDLPWYPNGTTESKFKESEIVSIVEWAIPEEYRAKMNEDDFIPVDHRLSELLAKLETIESVLKLAEYRRKQKKTSGKRSPDQRSRQSLATPNKRKKFFCREHGHNNTHASADCKVLQAKASGTFRPKGNDNKKKSNRNFCPRRSVKS